MPRSSLASSGLCHEVFEHCAVFDFGHPIMAATQRGGACFELRWHGRRGCVSFWRYLRPSHWRCPLRELEVAPLGIVRYGVEEVFKVVECHAGNEQFAFWVLAAKTLCSGGRYVRSSAIVLRIRAKEFGIIVVSVVYCIGLSYNHVARTIVFLLYLKNIVEDIRLRIGWFCCADKCGEVYSEVESDCDVTLLWV